MKTLRIPWGNDFYLRVQINREVRDGDGTLRSEAMPLGDDEFLHAHLVRAEQVYHMTIARQDTEGLLLCRACGRRLGYGHYALEVQGRTDGHHWRLWRRNVVWIEDEGKGGTTGPDETYDDGAGLYELGSDTVLWRGPVYPRLWVEAETMRLRAANVPEGDMWVDNYGHLWTRREADMEQ